jgi:putative oxidoreductase
VSFVLAGEMAVAYFRVHYPQSFWPSVNGGTPTILFCFIFLYFVFAGGGPWSVDAMIARSKGSNPD